MKRILFTGFTSIVGEEIANLFLINKKKNFTVSAIIRKPLYKKNCLPIKMVVDKFFIGNLEDQFFLEKVIKEFNPDIIVHLAQIIYSKNIIASLNRIGISPYLIILGTTSVFSKYASYSNIYKESEEFIFSNYSNLLLLRSTLIYGSQIDINFSKLFKKISSKKFIFLTKKVLNTQYQPMFYKDLSKLIKIIVDSNKKKIGAFTITGPDTLSLGEIINLISEFCESKPRYIFISEKFIITILKIFQQFNFLNLKIPVNITKVKRSFENKVYKSDLKELFPDAELTTIYSGLLSQNIEIKKFKNFF